MARYTKSQKQIPKMSGPSGGELLTCKFSVVTTALTALEEAGCTVARTGTGTYVVTLNKVYKSVTANVIIQTAAGAETQSVWLTGSTTSSLTLTQFTAGSSTAVDVLTFTAHIQIMCRSNS